MHRFHTYSPRREASAEELRVILRHVQYRQYGPVRLASDLGLGIRAAKYWGTCGRRVPPAVLGLAIALAMLTAEQYAEWRTTLKFLRS